MFIVYFIKMVNWIQRQFGYTGAEILSQKLNPGNSGIYTAVLGDKTEITGKLI
jgi:hypothetical protein